MEADLVENASSTYLYRPNTMLKGIGLNRK